MIERYSTPEMREHWSEQAKFQAWLDVELAACEVWTGLGRIPAAEMDVIRRRAAFDVARIDEIEAEVHHDVIAFTTSLAENIGPASRFVHMGLTSNDVVDTANGLRLKKAGALILADLDRLIDTLRRFADEKKDLLMVGRTHGIHAEPVTLGLKFLVYHQEMRRNRARLTEAFRGVAVGKISGAVGTFAHTGPAFETAVCDRLGLDHAPVSTQVLQRDRHAALVAAIAVAGAGIEKIATEIRHLQRTEVREIEEPFAKGQKGSSAMPHKRNPVKCEQLTGLARLLRGYVVPALENIALWHERDISHSSTERVILPDATTLLHYMTRMITRIVDGLHIYPEAMKRNLDRTRGLIFSQRVLLALVDHGMTREDAYDVVQKAAMRTWENEAGSLRQNLLADTRFTAVMKPEDLETVMDYRVFLQHLDAIYERARNADRP